MASPATHSIPAGPDRRARSRSRARPRTRQPCRSRADATSPPTPPVAPVTKARFAPSILVLLVMRDAGCRRGRRMPPAEIRSRRAGQGKMDRSECRTGRSEENAVPERMDDACRVPFRQARPKQPAGFREKPHAGLPGDAAPASVDMRVCARRVRRRAADAGARAIRRGRSAAHALRAARALRGEQRGRGGTERHPCLRDRGRWQPASARWLALPHRRHRLLRRQLQAWAVRQRRQPRPRPREERALRGQRRLQHDRRDATRAGRYAVAVAVAARRSAPAAARPRRSGCTTGR